eukprot:CAMPEP_0168392362 /NCGR_PEP_ID=MMETSP0228-20121227/18458_1 /TAXON_ID=133427 /ORGANISM="Protoceratium reticulatum, Strain CCCM 535 (=CCMP 1889)" /LENGTH=270 /DNA_ID=CAMNT_0008405699 /DNA_START=85 /DNA_END=894 /DNA_ORIENTATION=-
MLVRWRSASRACISRFSIKTRQRRGFTAADFAPFVPNQTPTAELDDFGLVAYASILLHHETSPGNTAHDNATDLHGWQAVSERASSVLALTGTPGVLVWLLDLFADADLHPSQRKYLEFPRRFRDRHTATQESLDSLSDDELCLAWSALNRLQLLNKQSSLLFYRAVTASLDSEPKEAQRCSRFSVDNWVRVAVGLRGFKEHHPLHMNFVSSTVVRLLVNDSKALAQQGLQLQALHAVSRATRLSSRQVHRVTAQLHALLPALSPAEASS